MYADHKEHLTPTEVVELMRKAGGAMMGKHWQVTRALLDRKMAIVVRSSKTYYWMVAV